MRSLRSICGGERSVTCKGAFDAHPSTGPLPPGAPPVCEAFRQQPDALERAAELDVQYGRTPDLQELPMYCVAFSFKDVIDTTDMRSTGGGDVDYAMDAAPLDATVVGVLREKGAIIYAKANLSEYNGGSGDPGGAAEAPSRTFGAGARSSWGGPPAIPTTPYESREAPVQGRRRRSAPTWWSARSARKPAVRAASPHGVTTWSRS